MVWVGGRVRGVVGGSAGRVMLLQGVGRGKCMSRGISREGSAVMGVGEKESACHWGIRRGKSAVVGESTGKVTLLWGLRGKYVSQGAGW